MAAKKPPDEDNRECLYVSVEQTERKVIPSVQLERREIKMTFSPFDQSLSSAVTDTDQRKDSDAERIVGKEYPKALGAEGSVVVSKVIDIQGHGKEKKKRSDDQSDQESRSRFPLKIEDGQHENVLEFFEEQGKTFQEQAKSLVPKVRKDRSTSPSHLRQSVGLDHLDNLVKLMEQLSTLKDENSKLKKKCDYLESTKTLLQAKSAVETEITIPSGYHSLPVKSKLKRSPKERSRTFRPRLSSAEDIDVLDSCESLESSSDTSPKRPKHAQIHKRSFSTGSLEIPSDIMEQSGEDDSQEGIYHTNGKMDRKMSKSPAAKRKSKISNWTWIKKVLSTKKLPEDIGFSFKSLGKIGGNVRAGSTKELSVPVTSIENRSVDSGVGSGVEADTGEGQRKSTGEVTLSNAQQGGESGCSPTSKLNFADLDSEIWMGPPEWLEEHEDEMNLVDPISIIENKEVIVLKSSAGKEENEDNLLQVPIPRRKSSPSLLEHESNSESEEKDLAEMEEYLNLRRSSSYKGRSSTGEVIHVPEIPKTPKKLHRSKLSKMKYMVSKHSVKRKLSKRSSAHSEADDLKVEGYDFDDEEGPLGRSTPKTSPLTLRQKSIDSKLPPTWISHMGTSIDVLSLMGGMSDEFSKKMQQWEDLKTKRSPSAVLKDSSDVSDGVFSSDSFGPVSPEFQKKMDDWERSKSIKSTSSKKLFLEEKSETDLPVSRDVSPDGTSTPLEISLQSINVDDMQKKLTDSFSRKMEEWERRKYRKDGTSPTLDRKDSGGRLIKKEDRQKSRKSKIEKDREKLGKMRGREMRRVEIEQQKLEKEKMKIEKERLRALEREARIEKMKGRLSQPDMDAKVKSPILAPLAEYKVTTDFARKLHEWEMRKGISSVSMATYYESQLRHADHLQQADYSGQKDSDDELAWNEPKKVKGQKPPPLTLQPCLDSPEETSPGARSSDASFDDNTSITMESMTENNIKSLEAANVSLVEELHAKELEYEALQEEVQDLNEKVNSARVQHSKEIDQYKKEILAGGTSAQVPKLTQEMSSKLAELESKIHELQSFGDNLAQKMESAAMCKWQSIEGEEKVTTRLVELLEKMRLMLYKASQTEELTQKSSALYTFEKLYSQAMQLQVQLTNLRLSQLERNKEIVSMKRQLLLQEANNLLLQADIARRETELNWHKQHARKGTPIKRWNTYGGMESRVVEGQEAECIPPYKRFAKGRKEPTQPTIESDDVMDTPDSDEQHKESLDFQSVEPPESPIEIQHKSCIYLPMRQQHKRHKAQLHKELSLEIPFIDQEQEDAVRVLPDNTRERQVMKGEKGVEISLTIKLPTANINLPRDISQQELNVPRSTRQEDSDDSSRKGESEPKVHKSEAKFPELLIPRSKSKGKLEKENSMELSELELQIHAANKTKDETKVKRESGISVGSDSVFVEGTPTEYKRMMIPVRVTKLSDDRPSHEAPHQEIHRETIMLLPKQKKHSDDQQSHDSHQEIHRETITLSPKLCHRTLQRTSPTSPRNTAPVSDKTFNWPKVRTVSYTGHRIKPADELLEESKRYRKGHSAYMSRILQKYKTDESRKFLMERQKSHDKENIAEGYVQAIVKRLSREGTPDILVTGDSTPKHYVSYRSDSPQGRSEFVQQIVKKLSSPADQTPQTKSQSSPLKDVTNGIPKKVKKLAEVFDSGSARNTPERALSDSESPHKSHIVTSKSKDRTSQSVSYDSSSSTSTLTSITGATEITYHPETSVSSSINYFSMPLLTVQEENPTDLQQSYRERAATTTTCDSAADQGVKSPMEKQEVLVTIQPWNKSRSTSQQMFHHHEGSPSTSQASSSKHSTEVKLHIGQKPGKVKKETIGALCQQSMLSFDLGLSLQASEQIQGRKDSEADSGYSGKSPRPLSSGSEGEPSSSSEEKRKSKSKFFEVHWFHKPKKFFKVSKC
ncbi:calponin homology domain-containing protein DDB_G0272472-like isoform X3 [Mytilus edulis]|uniref:calponin homology domain-containing protein DDB_G0272472-like isoform X3 n=1 Tax=Mytilus edulis TaxID=6550 RepID=UPI0039F09A66